MRSKDSKQYGKAMATFSFVVNKLKSVLKWYKGIWINYTYNKYGEFLYKKAAVMLVITFTSLIIAYSAMTLVFQTAYYFATYKKETIYLSQSEEIYPDDNIWNVRGCYTEYCDSNSSIYFRINPSVFHHLWNLIHSGRVFLPDMLGSSVPTGLTKCEIVSYGIRMRMTMLFNIYPKILKISCDSATPLNR